MVLMGTKASELLGRMTKMDKRKKGAKNRATKVKHGQAGVPDGVRERIMEAAFAVLMERGYARASTLEIATRARVSKRELYALFGDKRGVLVAMIARRAARMHRALTLPLAVDRASLAATLTDLGTTLLQEVCHPTVTALFRVAISEAERSPEMARVLDENGRGTHRAALTTFLGQIRQVGLIGNADPETMAAQFLSLLFGDTLLRVLMHAVDPPSPRDCARRARGATAAVLQFYPATSSA
jgi:AcrR family transcriptional regulator